MFYLSLYFNVLYMLYEVVVFQSRFEVFAITRVLVAFQKGSALCGSFEVIPDSHRIVLEDITHDCQESHLHLLISVTPLNLVQTIESNNQAIWMTLHVLVVVGKNFSHFFEFSLRYRFHHVLPVFCVVK